MENVFTIKNQGVTEPIVGCWYAAFTIENAGGEDERHVDLGVLGEYAGSGEFYDDDSDSDLGTVMRQADYIVEQV